MYISRDVVFDETYFPFAHNSKGHVSSSVSKPPQIVLPDLDKAKSNSLSTFYFPINMSFDTSPMLGYHLPLNSFSSVSPVSSHEACPTSQNHLYVSFSVVPVSTAPIPKGSNVSSSSITNAMIT